MTEEYNKQQRPDGLTVIRKDRPATITGYTGIDWVSHKGLCSGFCLRSTAIPSLTTAYSIISTPTTRSDNTPAGLTVLTECTTDVRRKWYLQLNLDKSESLIVGTTNQLSVVTSSVSSASVAGVDLSVAEEIKVLEVVLDQRLTFHKHVSAVARSCNYHAQAVRHI